MTPGKAIFVCEQARGPHWQLAPPVGGRLVLLGWRGSADHERGGGVPGEVASLLARAFASVGTVTFPRSPDGGPAISSEDHVRTLEPTGWGERIGMFFARRPLRFLLVSTRRPDVARTLFDDPGFPWWLQGQVILLSQGDAPPPAIDRNAILSLIAADRPMDLAVHASMGVAAIIRPGVDGDIAGIMSASNGVERQLLRSIEQEAARSGFSWRVLPEDRFADELVRGEP